MDPTITPTLSLLPEDEEEDEEEELAVAVDVVAGAVDPLGSIVNSAFSSTAPSVLIISQHSA